MKKISQENLDFLLAIVNTAHSCGIDSLIIDRENIRGQIVDQNTGIFILEPQPNQTLEFDSIGIGRIGVLNTRLNLLNDKNIEINFDTKSRDNNDEIVTKLYLSNKKTKMEFNCTDPNHIKSPKKVHDQFCYSFIINDDTLKLMTKTHAALNLNHITFSSELDGSVHFRASDVEGDRLDHIVCSSYVIDPAADKDQFFFKYSIKLLLPLLKNVITASNEKVKVHISKRGYMKFRINGLNTYILGEI